MWDLIVSVPDHCLSFYFAVVPGNRLLGKSVHCSQPRIRNKSVKPEIYCNNIFHDGKMSYVFMYNLTALCNTVHASEVM